MIHRLLLDWGDHHGGDTAVNEAEYLSTFIEPRPAPAPITGGDYTLSPTYPANDFLVLNLRIE